MIKTYFLILLSLGGSIGLCSAQNRTNPGIRVVKDKNGHKSKVIFPNARSDGRPDTLDLNSINPFGKFNAFAPKLNDCGTPFYQLDTTLVGDSLDGIELVSKIFKHRTSDLKPFRLWSMITTNCSDSVAAINCLLVTLNSSNKSISCHSMVKIYNSKKELLHQTPIWDINAYGATATDDGRFIAFKIGGSGWAEQADYIPYEFWVYDNKKMNIILKEELKFDNSIGVIEGRLFSTSANITNVSTTVTWYDFYHNAKYCKTFSPEEFIKRHEIDSKGIYYLDSKGHKYLKYGFGNEIYKTKIF